MWLFLNNAFLSIVAPDTKKFKVKGDVLIVRARIKGDIERVFPKANVTSSKKTDYQFRAVVKRDAVATAIAKFILTDLDYTNFKDSIPKNDGKRHSAYLQIWSVMNTRYGAKRDWLSPAQGIPIAADEPHWDWDRQHWTK